MREGNSQHGERIATWALRICLLEVWLDIYLKLHTGRYVPHLVVSMVPKSLLCIMNVGRKVLC